MDQVTAMLGQFGLSAELYSEDLIGDILAHGGSEWAAIKPIEATGRKRSRRALQRRRNKDNLLHLLHVYLESGLPPIVGVPKHAVVSVGLEYASRPQVRRPGRVISSTDFIASIVVNDDNFAPYQRVVRSTQYHGSVLNYSCDDIDALVVPLPEKLFLVAEKAEIIVTALLECFGPPSITPGLSKDERFVRRLYCTSSKNYRTFRARDADPVSAQLLRHPLPHFLWVGELSPLSTWGTPLHAAVVEVALDATAGPYDKYPFLWIRYPEAIVINYGRIYGYRAEDSPLVVFDVRSPLTVSPFSGNLRSFT